MGPAPTKKSFAVYLTFILTMCPVFCLITLLTVKSDPYPQDDFSDIKCSSDHSFSV